MRVLKIKEILGTDRLISSDKGHKLNEIIKEHISKDEKVTLDFEGINVAVTRFFNQSIGSLYGDFDYEKVDNLLEFRNASDSILFMINKAIKSAKEYYSNPEEFQRKSEEAYAML